VLFHVSTNCRKHTSSESVGRTSSTTQEVENVTGDQEVIEQDTGTRTTRLSSTTTLLIAIPRLLLVSGKQ
jgi:hypothetical protein